TITGLHTNTIYYFATTSYVVAPSGHEYESGYSNEVIFNDNDRDWMADDWESSHGFDPLNEADAYLDSDNDGYPNLTEYSGGTDPHNPESHPSVTLGVQHVTVTDVTPTGFSVIWQVTEPSLCYLVIYDESGTHLSDIEIVSESALHPPAEDNGVMKVRVSGLEASKTYRLRTLTMSKQSGLILVAPYPQQLEILTELDTTLVVNDSIRQEIYDEEGDPAEGTLLVASVAGGTHPITAWVGDSIASPWALVDLGRLFSSETHNNIRLRGGEQLALWSFGGQLGNTINIQEITPPDGEVHDAFHAISYLIGEPGYTFDLTIDLNVLGFPVQLSPPLTSYGLLLYLKEQAGGSTVVDSVKRYNKETGKWDTASWFSQQPAGDDFPIEPGNGYLIYMKDALPGVTFEGIPVGTLVDLLPGLNLVGLPADNNPGFTYTSYQMLQDLGNDQQVAYVKRYDPYEGWQTTSWFEGNPAGDLFDIREGEGYFVYMKERKENWRPY
ncbi:MAG: hypothetical protein P8075_17170, partial [Deltaproteobacteria bacterium]